MNITKIKALFLKNWFPKLICLLIALGLWSWVVIQQSSEQEFQVPVEFYDIPENYMVSPESDRTVTVVLRGQRTTLSSVGRANLQVEVSLSGIQARQKQVQILPWHVQHPAGLEVVDIRPRSIQVQLEMRIEKVVEVRPAFHGEKNEDYTYQIEISPDTALVAGVRSELENLDAIHLAKLQLPTPEDPPLETNVEALLPPHLVMVEPPTNNFFIRVEVFEPYMKRTIEGVKVEVREKLSDWQAIVEPSEIEVKVRGPKNIVQDLRPEDIIAYVNAPESGGGPEIKVIRFSLPESVEQVESAELARTAKVRLVEQ